MPISPNSGGRLHVRRGQKKAAYILRQIDPSIDVKLLQTLHLLFREKSVSRVAMLLGLSQPAVSLTLKRGRRIFSDPLLVRSGQKLVLSDHGLEVQRAIETVLDSLAEALNPEEEFDPEAARFRMRITAANCFGTYLIPAIGERIRREAPGILVDFFAPSEHVDLVHELGAGRIDVVIGNWPDPAESLRHAALMHCAIACVMRADHPFATLAGISLEKYLSIDHISPTPGSSAAFSPIDGRLHQLGVRRRIAMCAPEFALIPEVLLRTDLVFTTARPYAEQIVMGAPKKLRLVEAPQELGEMRLYMLWHERSQLSRRNIWLRNLIKDTVRHSSLMQP